MSPREIEFQYIKTNRLVEIKEFQSFTISYYTTIRERRTGNYPANCSSLQKTLQISTFKLELQKK